MKFGIVDKMEPVLAMALGAGETTPFRLVGAYSAFPNGGRRIEPHLIEQVGDRTGQLLYRADKRECPHCSDPFGGQDSPRIPLSGAQVMDPITAYSITLMLQGVVQNGTGAAVSQLGYPLAGKTGTTNAFRSAWFVGYSPTLVAGVFVGFDDNRSLGEGETGAVAAVPIFMDFMREALKGQPKTEFKAPKDTRFIDVGGHREAFRPGQEPESVQAAPKADAPIPYNQLPTDLNGLKPGQVAPPPKPPEAKKVTDDLKGLY